jgi:hypothetical protein
MMPERAPLDRLNLVSWVVVLGGLFFSRCTPGLQAARSPSPPVSTLTQEPTASPATLATLPAEATQAIIEEYLRDNNHCELPCWWGITPGETTFEEAEQILAPIANSIRQGETRGNRTNFTVTYEIGPETSDAYTLYSVADGIVELIWVKPGGTDISYQLDQVISNYRPPTDLYTYYDESPAGTLLHLVLVYPEKGVLFRYPIETQEVGDQLRSCPKGVGPEIWLWNPDQPRTIADILGSEIEGQLEPYEEVTGTSIEEFSLQFQDLNTNPCIEVSR